MTTISTTADLLRLLREDPDFRDQVRSLLLTQELIELPERFARFEAYVERHFETLETSVNDRFESMETRMKERFESMETSMDRQFAEVRGELGRIKGGDYERRVGGSFASYASMAFRQRQNRSLRRNMLIYSQLLGRDNGFGDLIANAVDNGSISEDERAELEQADAVMSGQDAGDAVYFVGEISLTVNNADIDRAIARAAIMQQGHRFGCLAHGYREHRTRYTACEDRGRRGRGEAGGRVIPILMVYHETRSTKRPRHLAGPLLFSEVRSGR